MRLFMPNQFPHTHTPHSHTPIGVCGSCGIVAIERLYGFPRPAAIVGNETAGSVGNDFLTKKWNIKNESNY